MIKKKKIQVATLIPNYNGRALLQECLSSLLASNYFEIEHFIYVIDNGSSDGSVAYLRKHWPQVRLIKLRKNLGYAGANNIGWQKIKKDLPNIDYLYLFNSDAVATKNFLKPLVIFMNQHPECGSAQSKLLLYRDKQKINSLGNVIHFLGFGYSSYCNLPEKDIKLADQRINYASGTAALLRIEAIKEVGLFENFMFMYLEDLDLGWRLKLAGWDNYLVPDSVVYHKYDFTRGMKQYYYFERNRLYIVLKNYKLLTLLLITPACLLMEIGQILFAIKNKNFLKKLKSYLFFISFKHISLLMKARKKIKTIRKISDRQLLRTFSGRIEFQPLTTKLMVRFVNPFFSSYLKIIRVLIFW